MKFIQIFTKTPNHKRFGYKPRHYDPMEEELKERTSRIKEELKLQDEGKKEESDLSAYRSKIAGSFRAAKKTTPVQSDPSASMMRLVVLLILVIGLIAYLQFGNIALYITAALFIPFYFYLKFRKLKRG